MQRSYQAAAEIVERLASFDRGALNEAFDAVTWAQESARGLRLYIIGGCLAAVALLSTIATRWQRRMAVTLPNLLNSWAMLGLNQRLPPCEDGTLPLS